MNAKTKHSLVKDFIFNKHVKFLGICHVGDDIGCGGCMDQDEEHAFVEDIKHLNDWCPSGERDTEKIVDDFYKSLPQTERCDDFYDIRPSMENPKFIHPHQLTIGD